ncbi:MAG: DNA replication/repair protein RecF [Dokdonella sp.]
MRLIELRLENLRRFEQLSLALAPGWNVFVGDNGAGKTTVLEAAYMLSHGHSFRSGGRVGVQRDGSEGYSIFGRLEGSLGEQSRVGLARTEGKLIARIEGETVPIGELVERCAVVCFEPGSHDLIAGPAEIRRQFMDWGVFHVEHSFLSRWRRYQRALKQRNALLRQGAVDSEFAPWDAELAESGEWLADTRYDYIDRLREHLEYFAKRLIPELGKPVLDLARGWDAGIALRDLFQVRLPRDRERGHTMRGPHRADWSTTFERAPRREHYSRGQEKLVALACLLAQARLHAQVQGHWPVLCLDDLASELDVSHQQAVVDVLAEVGAQVLVTGVTLPDGLRNATFPVAMFHVEHGSVAPLI